MKRKVKDKAKKDPKYGYKRTNGIREITRVEFNAAVDELMKSVDPIRNTSIPQLWWD